MIRRVYRPEHAAFTLASAASPTDNVAPSAVRSSFPVFRSTSYQRQPPPGDVVVARYDDTKRYYWVAINGAAIPAWLSAPMPMPTVTPVPEMLFGFVDQVEATSVQHLLLTASHEECAQQFRVLAARQDVAFVKFRAPEKPDPTKETLWSFANPGHT